MAIKTIEDEIRERNHFHRAAVEDPNLDPISGYDFTDFMPRWFYELRGTIRASSEPKKNLSEKKEKKLSGDGIEFPDIVLYDAEGKPYKKYKKATLAGEAEKNAEGRYLGKTQDDWVVYWRERDKELLDFPLFYAIVERMQKTDHPGKAGLLKDLKENGLCLATRFDYKNNKIIHRYGFSPEEFSCNLPCIHDYLENIKDQKYWRSALQALLMPKDLDEAIEILHSFAGVKPHIWTPDKDGRKLYPERAAFVGACSDGLDLYCDGRLVNNNRSRWVVLEE